MNRNSPTRLGGVLLAALIASGCSSSSSAGPTSISPTPHVVLSTPSILSPPSVPAGPSRTFVSEVAFATRRLGWAAGLHCGDPGANGRCAILGSSTADGGKTWSAAVPVGQPEYSEDSSPRIHIRFSGLHGWVFGPGIYGTHDGGRTWRLQDQRPTLSLESAGSSVWAVTGCIRSQPCAPHLIESSAGSDRWNDAPTQPPASASNDAVLERAGATTTFLAAMNGSKTFSESTQLLVTRNSGADWTELAAPCQDLRQLRSLDGTLVWALCASQPGAGSQPKAVYVSLDGGRAWELRAQTSYPDAVGSLSIGGYAMTFVVTSASTGLIGSQRGGVSLSNDQGRNWSAPAADVVGGDAGLGVRQLWFVDPSHGWALGGYGSSGPALWATSDGGHHWAPSGNPLQTSEVS